MDYVIESALYCIVSILLTIAFGIGALVFKSNDDESKFNNFFHGWFKYTFLIGLIPDICNIVKLSNAVVAYFN